MTIIRHDRYYCSAKRERGTCNSSIGIAAAEIEDRVIAGLKSILIGREDLVETFTQEFNAELARLRKDHYRQERNFQKELNKTNAAISRCLTFIKEGEGDPGLVRGELKDLEGKKKNLEAQIDGIDDSHKIETHPNLAKLFSKKVGELQSLLSDEVCKPKAMEIIRSLVDRIEVRAGKGGKTPEITLVGSLARIFAYSQGNGQNNMVPDRTFLMVAEAGLVQDPTITRQV